MISSLKWKDWKITNKKKKNIVSISAANAEKSCA
jgi:hypothetical protein